jgi:hypothetical protein
MSYGRLVQVTRILGLVLAGLYALAAIAVLLADRSVAQTIVGVTLLGCGAALILLGHHLSGRWPVLAAAVVSVGAVVGAFPLIPLILPPIAATALIALSFMLARQPAPAP